MQHFLANSKMREENDIKEIYVGHELENKNKVHVIYDTPAPDTIQKMMQKPEVQEVMKNAWKQSRNDGRCYL